MDWLFYLIGLFFARIGDFLRHWYVSSYYVISDLTVRFLEWLDRSLALKVSVRYWLHPLFQERNAVGYIIGFFVRTVRIIFAAIIYGIIIAMAVGIYLLWLAVPLWLAYKTIQAYGIKTNIF